MSSDQQHDHQLLQDDSSIISATTSPAILTAHHTHSIPYSHGPNSDTPIRVHRINSNTTSTPNNTKPLSPTKQFSTTTLTAVTKARLSHLKKKVELQQAWGSSPTNKGANQKETDTATPANKQQFSPTRSQQRQPNGRASSSSSNRPVNFNGDIGGSSMYIDPSMNSVAEPAFPTSSPPYHYPPPYPPVPFRPPAPTPPSSAPISRLNSPQAGGRPGNMYPPYQQPPPPAAHPAWTVTGGRGHATTESIFDDSIYIPEPPMPPGMSTEPEPSPSPEHFYPHSRIIHFPNSTANQIPHNPSPYHQQHALPFNSWQNMPMHEMGVSIAPMEEKTNYPENDHSPPALNAARRSARPVSLSSSPQSTSFSSPIQTRQPQTLSHLSSHNRAATQPAPMYPYGVPPTTILDPAESSADSVSLRSLKQVAAARNSTPQPDVSQGRSRAQSLDYDSKQNTNELTQASLATRPLSLAAIQAKQQLDEQSYLAFTAPMPAHQSPVIGGPATKHIPAQPKPPSPTPNDILLQHRHGDSASMVTLDVPAVIEFSNTPTPSPVLAVTPSSKHRQPVKIHQRPPTISPALRVTAISPAQLQSQQQNRILPSLGVNKDNPTIISNASFLSQFFPNATGSHIGLQLAAAAVSSPVSPAAVADYAFPKPAPILQLRAHHQQPHNRARIHYNTDSRVVAEIATQLVPAARPGSHPFVRPSMNPDGETVPAASEELASQSTLTEGDPTATQMSHTIKSPQLQPSSYQQQISQQTRTHGIPYVEPPSPKLHHGIPVAEFETQHLMALSPNSSRPIQTDSALNTARAIQFVQNQNLSPVMSRDPSESKVSPSSIKYAGVQQAVAASTAITTISPIFLAQLESKLRSISAQPLPPTPNGSLQPSIDRETMLLKFQRFKSDVDQVFSGMESVRPSTSPSSSVSGRITPVPLTAEKIALVKTLHEAVVRSSHELLQSLNQYSHSNPIPSATDEEVKLAMKRLHSILTPHLKSTAEGQRVTAISLNSGSTEDIINILQQLMTIVQQPMTARKAAPSNLGSPAASSSTPSGSASGSTSPKSDPRRNLTVPKFKPLSAAKTPSTSTPKKQTPFSSALPSPQLSARKEATVNSGTSELVSAVVPSVAAATEPQTTSLTSSTTSSTTSSISSTTSSSSSTELVALWDFHAQMVGQLTISAGEILTLRPGGSPLHGWLQVSNSTGQEGHVPENYCRQTSATIPSKHANQTTTKDEPAQTTVSDEPDANKPMPESTDSAAKSASPIDVTSTDTAAAAVDVTSTQESAAAQPGPAETPHPQIEAISFRAFKAESDDELSFEVGTVMYVLTEAIDGWVWAENEQGKQGFIPEEFCQYRVLSPTPIPQPAADEATPAKEEVVAVTTPTKKPTVETIPNESQQPPSNTVLSPTSSSNLTASAPVTEVVEAIGLYPFTAQLTTQLSFGAGEVLKVLSPTVKGWLTIENGAGQRGHAPENYLQIQPPKIAPVAAAAPISADEVVANMAAASTAATATPTTATTTDVPKSDQQPVASPAASLTVALPDSTSKPTADGTTPVAAAIQPSPIVSDPLDEWTNSEVVCMYSFTKSKEGQMSFNSGDVLVLRGKPVSGWVAAENAQGQRGHVPENYIKLKPKPEVVKPAIVEPIKPVEVKAAVKPSIQPASASIPSTSAVVNPVELDALALYDFAGGVVGQLPFHKGDIMRVLSDSQAGWLHVQHKDGRKGNIPENFVKLVHLLQPKPVEVTNAQEKKDATVPVASPASSSVLFSPSGGGFTSSTTPTTMAPTSVVSSPPSATTTNTSAGVPFGIRPSPKKLPPPLTSPATLQAQDEDEDEDEEDGKKRLPSIVYPTALSSSSPEFDATNMKFSSTEIPQARQEELAQLYGLKLSAGGHDETSTHLSPIDFEPTPFIRGVILQRYPQQYASLPVFPFLLSRYDLTSTLGVGLLNTLEFLEDLEAKGPVVEEASLNSMMQLIDTNGWTDIYQDLESQLSTYMQKYYPHHLSAIDQALKAGPAMDFFDSKSTQDELTRYEREYAQLLAREKKFNEVDDVLSRVMEMQAARGYQPQEEDQQQHNGDQSEVEEYVADPADGDDDRVREHEHEHEHEDEYQHEEADQNPADQVTQMEALPGGAEEEEQPESSTVQHEELVSPDLDPRRAIYASRYDSALADMDQKVQHQPVEVEAALPQMITQPPRQIASRPFLGNNASTSAPPMGFSYLTGLTAFNHAAHGTSNPTPTTTSSTESSTSAAVAGPLTHVNLSRPRSPNAQRQKPSSPVTGFKSPTKTGAPTAGILRSHPPSPIVAATSSPSPAQFPAQSPTSRKTVSWAPDSSLVDLQTRHEVEHAYAIDLVEEQARQQEEDRIRREKAALAIVDHEEADEEPLPMVSGTNYHAPTASPYSL